ncbi:MAG: hypothetical protein RBU30_14220 [Polyangia bacterium]|nr:hypothetical protein [Polyangia bacterium]
MDTEPRRPTVSRHGLLSRLLVRGPLLLVLLCFAGPGCKEKPPKLTAAECDTFCRRLVPCFAQAMENFSMNVKEDTAACIRDCNGKESQSHGQILRAMKRCGHLKDCERLRSCFQESL